MAEFSAGENKYFHDLNPLFTGYEHCRPGHIFGPTVRDYYLLHFVLSGKGRFLTGGQEYHLSKGDCFLIKPGELTIYQADWQTPWFYVWIAFNGQLAEDFRHAPDVRQISPGPFQEIRMMEEGMSLKKEYLTSILFRIYCEFFQNRKEKKDYAKEIYQYICYNYMSDITVEGLAGMVSLDRRYLSRIFKEKYGILLKQFLVEYRMERAAQFLKEGMSVTCVADMVGYRDVCNFSKMYKKVMGISPASCRISETSVPPKPLSQGKPHAAPNRPTVIR